MTFVADAMNGLFDLLTAPFGGAAGWAVFVLSVAVGVLMLLLYKWSTDQEKLVAARQVLTGRVYEMGLYQDHLSVLMRIQRDLAVANLRYLRYSLPALAVIILPMILILAQLDARYGRRPFVPGETALLKVEVGPARSDLLDGLHLDAPPGVAVETAAVRDRRHGVATWRLRAEAAGRHEVRIVAGDGRAVTKAFTVGDDAPRIAAVREHESLGRLLLNPAEKPLPGDTPIKKIRLTVPGRDLHYAGVRTNWLVALIVFSLAAGLAVKDLFKVKF
jgi:hypothetical protein